MCKELLGFFVGGKKFAAFKTLLLAVVLKAKDLCVFVKATDK